MPRKRGRENERGRGRGRGRGRRRGRGRGRGSQEGSAAHPTKKKKKRSSIITMPGNKKTAASPLRGKAGTTGTRTKMAAKAMATGSKPSRLRSTSTSHDPLGSDGVSSTSSPTTSSPDRAERGGVVVQRSLASLLGLGAISRPGSSSSAASLAAGASNPRMPTGAHASRKPAVHGSPLRVGARAPASSTPALLRVGKSQRGRLRTQPLKYWEQERIAQRPEGAVLQLRADGVTSAVGSDEASS